MGEPLSMCRRKDGRYLRGARLWRWTRFPRRAAQLPSGTAEWYFRLYFEGRKSQPEYTIVQVTDEQRRRPKQR